MASDAFSFDFITDALVFAKVSLDFTSALKWVTAEFKAARCESACRSVAANWASSAPFSSNHSALLIAGNFEILTRAVGGAALEGLGGGEAESREDRETASPGFLGGLGSFFVQSSMKQVNGQTIFDVQSRKTSLEAEDADGIDGHPNSAQSHRTSVGGTVEAADSLAYLLVIR